MAHVPPTPRMHSLPNYQYPHTRVVHLLQQMNLQWHIIMMLIWESGFVSKTYAFYTMKSSHSVMSDSLQPHEL